jgi:hypothetical protein
MEMHVQGECHTFLTSVSDGDRWLVSLHSYLLLENKPMVHVEEEAGRTVVPLPKVAASCSAYGKSGYPNIILVVNVIGKHIPSAAVK